MNLTTHQRVLLSGESLINDASGVVSFNFAIAAALTGTFSAADAARSFAVLFFGGIAAGVVLGWFAVATMRALRNYGFENAAVRVLYEVLMPFVVFLVAERLGVSGILAVVATGLVMARTQPKLVSSTQAEYRLVSNSFWEVIVYVINGVVFTLLGMQLVTAFSPAVQESFGILRLLRTMAFVTFLVVLVRFVWVSALELPRHDERGERCACHLGETLRQSLVTTIAGPKGAVTLSIIFTIPPTMPDGSPFPERSLIIFLMAGVILLTLALADLTLPRLAPAKASEEDERAVYAASIKVLELTIAELEDRIASKKHPELESATRDVISRYRIRLTRERLALEGSGPILWDLIRGMLTAQQKRADEIQASGMEGISIDDIGPFMEALRSIRSSVGYYDRGERIGMRGFGLRGKLAMIRPRLQFRAASPERRQRIYYECCLFELELEKVALAYLADQVESGDASRAAVAQTLAREHEAAQISLGRRLRYHEKMMSSGNATLAKTHLDELLDNIEQYGAMIDAGALGVELEQVNKLYQRGEISSGVASDLRERVYLLQMELSE